MLTAPKVGTEAAILTSRSVKGEQDNRKLSVSKCLVGLNRREGVL